MEEHHLDNSDKFKDDPTAPESLSRLDKIDVYFEESGENRYVPRSILVDLEPGTLDVIKANPIGKTFRPDNFLFGASGKFKKKKSKIKKKKKKKIHPNIVFPG